MKQEKCYKCGENATSREHVPPLCIFPERKDIPSYDFRKNLITVPSCDKHNSKKSKDDEFLLASLTGWIGNNIIAYLHNSTKVRRLFERHGESFINVISRDPKPLTIVAKNGNIFPVFSGMPNVKRLNKCFEHIACGLYYHEFKEVFIGECKVIPAFINFKDDNIKNTIQVLKRRSAFDEEKIQKKGSNSQIFQYWFFEPDIYGLIGMKMTFFNGSEIYVCFRKKETPRPYDLISELIKSGLKVSVEFPDGKPPVEFNKKSYLLIFILVSLQHITQLCLY
jgi:hypothetical protein